MRSAIGAAIALAGLTAAAAPAGAQSTDAAPSQTAALSPVDAFMEKLRAQGFDRVYDVGTPFGRSRVYAIEGSTMYTFYVNKRTGRVVRTEKRLNAYPPSSPRQGPDGTGMSLDGLRDDQR